MAEDRQLNISTPENLRPQEAELHKCKPIFQLVRFLSKTTTYIQELLGSQTSCFASRLNFVECLIMRLKAYLVYLFYCHPFLDIRHRCLLWTLCLLQTCFEKILVAFQSKVFISMVTDLLSHYSINSGMNMDWKVIVISSRHTFLIMQLLLKVQNIFKQFRKDICKESLLI